MYDNNTNGFDLNLTQNELDDIYSNKLAVSDDSNFEYFNIENNITNLMENVFTKEFLNSDSLYLQSNPIILNNQLLLLIKTCKDNSCTRYEIAFVTFCDYFNLDISKVFNILHEKLRLIIISKTKAFVGKREYNRIERNIKDKEESNQGYKTNSIFDLIGNK
jgi:hypothetical protein